MIPPGYSTYVIYSCINMSCAPRQSRAQSKTSQSCSGPAAAVSAFTRRRLPYGAGQRSFAAPGLSLSATSSASEAAASGQRHQSRFHREAFSPIGEASSDSCPGGRLVLERVREPGVSGATNAETRAWLSGVPSAANFSSNIYLIVCCRISWNRFISCWSPTVPARLVVLALLCLRRICMTQAAAIYTRVSSDRQKEEHTIASQTAALLEYAQKHGYVVPPEWVFQDEGYSGATLIRPGLEALRDLAAQGQMVAVLLTPQFAPVFVAPFLIVLPVRRDQFNASLLQPLTQRVGIVAAVGDHALGFLPRAAGGRGLRPAWLPQQLLPCFHDRSSPANLPHT